MSKNIVETEEGEQTISIVGVIIDATIGVEGGGVANCIVQDTSEELDAGRVFRLAERNCHIQAADIN